MNENEAIGALKAVIGATMTWLAVDTATLDVEITWPKWLLVPLLLAYAFGFFASALPSTDSRDLDC